MPSTTRSNPRNVTAPESLNEQIVEYNKRIEHIAELIPLDDEDANPLVNSSFLWRLANLLDHDIARVKRLACVRAKLQSSYRLAGGTLHQYRMVFSRSE